MLRLTSGVPLLHDPFVENKTMYWHSTDSHISYMSKTNDFKENYKTQIEYKFNSMGYRTKEISDINSDFLLTFGCSYTEGVGLPPENVWNYHVAKFLKIDLFNCAKEATGMDIQFYNSMLWKNGNLPKPKLVIVQWPHKSRKRFGYKTNDEIELRDSSDQNSADGKWWKKRYITDVGDMEFNNFVWFESFNNIWESMKVPVLNFTWDDDLNEVLKNSKFKLWHIEIKHRDLARDGLHPGPKMQKETYSHIKNILHHSNFTYKV